MAAQNGTVDLLRQQWWRSMGAPCFASSRVLHIIHLERHLLFSTLNYIFFTFQSQF
jgi:hypothetical protein